MERDPNDTVKISFPVKDEEMIEWIDSRVDILKKYDPGFYIKTFCIGDRYLYHIFTQAKHLEHEEYKKFIFQVTLKVGQDVKIR